MVNNVWKDILKKEYNVEFQLFTTPDKVRYRMNWDSELQYANYESDINQEIEDMKPYAEKFHEDMIDSISWDMAHGTPKQQLKIHNELLDMILVIVINDNIVASRENNQWTLNYGKQ